MCSLASACFFRFTCSETVKITKKTTEKETPARVATDLVARFTSAVESRTSITENRPMGISVPAMVMFGGTFQPRSPLYLKRRTSMDRLLKVKLDLRSSITENRPMGISVPAMVMFGGTFQPRSPLYLKRRTSMDRLLKVKLVL